jgi:hypothetical protein
MAHIEDSYVDKKVKEIDPEFITKYFLAILDRFTTKINARKYSEKKKQQTLMALNKLLVLVGPHLAHFYLKVINTLKLLRQTPTLMQTGTFFFC